MAKWYNSDGLSVEYGRDPTITTMGKVSETAPIQHMVVDFTYDDLPTFNADLNNDGTDDGFVPSVPAIPRGSHITRAFLIVKEDWATADAATLTLGLYNAAGAAIDADGIDAAIAATALDEGEMVVCDGALVAGATNLITADGYLVVTNANTFTSGSARLVVEFIAPPAVGDWA